MTPVWSFGKKTKNKSQYSETKPDVKEIPVKGFAKKHARDLEGKFSKNSSEIV
jgi:hypothetical protein